MKIEVFEDIIMENLQFPKDLETSNLWKTLMEHGLNKEDAIYAAHRHCNSLSFYAICRAHEWIMFPYLTWIEKLEETDSLVVKNGWVKGEKTAIASQFGFGDKFHSFKYVGSYDLLINPKQQDTTRFYQIRVYSNSNKRNTIEGGTHFMGAYFMNGVLYITDSGNRGKRVRFVDVVPREKFMWGLEI
jgi:hypothetical protein